MANAVRESVVQKVANVAGPLCRSLGLELVDVEYLREGQTWVLRLFIDKPGGIKLEDCSELSHALGPALDVEEVLETAYPLEVSSPGIERPLKKPEDFQRFAGKRVQVKTYAPLPQPHGPQKNFQGILRGLVQGEAGDQVALDADGQAVHIPLSAIAKAHLLLEL